MTKNFWKCVYFGSIKQYGSLNILLTMKRLVQHCLDKIDSHIHHPLRYPYISHKKRDSLFEFRENLLFIIKVMNEISNYVSEETSFIFARIKTL